MLKIILLLCSFFITNNSYADKIAAVVDNKIILVSDLNKRIDLMRVLSRNNHEVEPDYKFIRNTALDSLIREALLNKEAENYKLEILEEEVIRYIALIEQRSSMPEGYLKNFFAHNNISEDTYKNYIKGQLLPNKLISSNIKRTVKTGRSEIEDIIKITEKSLDVVVKIFSIKVSEHKAYSKLADFRRLATNNNKDYKKALEKNKIAIQTIGQNISKFDKTLQTIIRDLDVGEVSGIIERDKELLMIMLCKSNVSELGEKHAESIFEVLMNNKMSSKAQKYFKDLRKKAFVKVYL